MDIEWKSTHLLDFGRDWCGDLAISGTREWLVTNGLGGYASGTAAGFLSRRYHGLLIAAQRLPVGRTLLLSKLDETATYDEVTYPLFTNHWSGGELEPYGFHHLERFHFEGTTPVWTFACADANLVKKVWMQPGANTTYVDYELARATRPLELDIKVLVNHRDHHANTRAGDWQLHVEPIERGMRLDVLPEGPSFYLFSPGAQITPKPEWHTNYYLAVEEYRGLDPVDDNLSVGFIQARLRPGESLTVIASTQPEPNLDGIAAYAERRSYEDQLIAESGFADRAPWARQLVLAADQFIVHRPLPDEPEGCSIIAGYPWFGDWGRDTMISLPGLTLSTGRNEVARQILRTFSRYVDQGMLPNNFPEAGEKPEYNTVDATLWYFEALRAYYAQTRDDELLAELLPILEEIIAWHRRGTRYQIHLDSQDGLLYAGEAGVQLTWMDAKVGDWVVTPRIGKPVEVNALWFNALKSMASFTQQLGKSADEYEELADASRNGFKRFWNESTGYCYDVLDGPDGDDPSLRPNQLFAVSLPHSPLPGDRQRAIVEVCAQQLLTSHGLRSLAAKTPEGAGNPAFVGHYGGDQRQRDAAYHQGTVWGWLIGPFVSAHLKVYQDPELAQTFLRPLISSLASHGLGTLSEIFDANPPYIARGCIAQAWTVAEVLRIWQELDRQARYRAV